MMHIKGQKTPAVGAEAEVESRNLEAKCIYASLTPKVSGYWLLTTGFRLLLFVLFLLATLAPFEFPLSKGGDRGLFPWGLGVVDAFAADNGYFPGSIVFLFMMSAWLFVMPVYKNNPYKRDDDQNSEINFETHSVSSFSSNMYPRINNARAEASPNQKAYRENLSESRLPIIGAVTIILLKSYAYLERFSLCFLFIVLPISYHRAVVMSMSNIGKFQINCKLFTGGVA